MQIRTPLHFLPPNDRRYLHEGFNVVVGVEDRKLLREEEEQNHTSRPDVDSYSKLLSAFGGTAAKGKPLTSRLFAALQQYFWRAEAPCARSVRLRVRPAAGVSHTRVCHLRADSPVVLGRVTDLVRSSRASQSRLLLHGLDALDVELRARLQLTVGMVLRRRCM